MDLSYNFFGGEIPYLGKLKNLEKLDLSYNSLISSIPRSLDDMVSLSNIDLSHNQLKGPIPDIKIFQSSHHPEAALSHNKNLCGKIKGLPLYKVTSSEHGGRNKRGKSIATIVVETLVNACWDFGPS